MAKIKVVYKTFAEKIIEVPDEIMDNEDELFETAQRAIGWEHYLSAVYDENGACLAEGFEE